MSNSSRIIFFGTPQFAVYTLEALLEANLHIVAVVTSPNRKAGRGKKERASAVCIAAQNHQLPLLQPENLKDDAFVAQLKALNPTLMVVVAFRMLPEKVWSLPANGTFNLHASLLPKYRGAAPINWAIINKEKETGLTTFLIDAKIDTGQLLLQQKLSIATDETAGSLHDKMAIIGGELVVRTIAALENQNIEAESQPVEGDFPLAPKLDKINTRIDWTQALDDIEAFIRGLSPYPGAWTTLVSAEATFNFKIFKAEITYEKHAIRSGSLRVEKKRIGIAHPQGWLYCEELQLPNKRRMTARALLNGYEFSEFTQIR